MEKDKEITVRRREEKIHHGGTEDTENKVESWRLKVESEISCGKAGERNTFEG